MSENQPYQVTPQTAQLQAERANAAAYGNDTRVAEIDRQLSDLGVKAKAAEERKAASEATADAGDPDEAKRTPPKGRAARSTSKADG